jgi:hypothetical protein
LKVGVREIKSDILTLAIWVLIFTGNVTEKIKMQGGAYRPDTVHAISFSTLKP